MELSRTLSISAQLAVMSPSVLYALPHCKYEGPSQEKLDCELALKQAKQRWIDLLFSRSG